MRLFSSSFLAFLLVLGPACGGGSAGTSQASGGASSGSSNAGSGGGGSGGTGTAGSGATGGTGGATGGTGGQTTTSTTTDKAATCASTFGNALTNAFGRLDGTVLAVVQPGNMKCALPNSDHVVLQVTMKGAAYRMVINVKSTVGDPNVQYLKLDHALPGPAWDEGWHTGLALDYVADFGVHAKDFTPHPLAELSNIVADDITIGQKVSVYATSSGGASAHEVHRNDGKVDGAVILDPDGAAPRALLFHFADQSF
jgi:hypothetical protein